MSVKDAKIAVLAQFGVMLRQASFFVEVEYEKSTLPQQKIRLPRLTPNCIQYHIAQTEPVRFLLGPVRQVGSPIKKLIFLTRRQTASTTGCHAETGSKIVTGNIHIPG